MHSYQYKFSLSFQKPALPLGNWPTLSRGFNRIAKLHRKLGGSKVIWKLTIPLLPRGHGPRRSLLRHCAWFSVFNRHVLFTTNLVIKSLHKCEWQRWAYGDGYVGLTKQVTNQKRFLEVSWISTRMFHGTACEWKIPLTDAIVSSSNFTTQSLRGNLFEPRFKSWENLLKVADTFNCSQIGKKGWKMSRLQRFYRDAAWKSLSAQQQSSWRGAAKKSRKALSNRTRTKLPWSKLGPFWWQDRRLTA